MNPSLLAGVGLAALSAGLLSWWAAQGMLALVKPSTLPTKAWSGRIPIRAHLGVLCALAAVAALGLAGFPVLFILFPLALGWYALKNIPIYLKKIERNKKMEGMRELFPQALGMMVQSLKTGQTVQQVFEYLSAESPSPLKEEWSLVCSELNLGASADQALSKMCGRFEGFIELRQFLESYRISRQTGANLIHLLEVLMDGMEEKNRLFRKREALTAQARLSGLLMGLLPLLLGAVFFFMDPGLILPLFTEKTGWAILLLAGLLETIGFLWIRQLLRLEF